MDKESLKKRIRQQYKFSKKLSKEQTRKLTVLAHNRCVDRIIIKASQYGRTVLVQEESYTSKTCGNCGLLDNNLGANKIYHCRDCGRIVDRDVNGARNIMIKGICTIMGK